MAFPDQANKPAARKEFNNSFFPVTHVHCCFSYMSNKNQKYKANREWFESNWEMVGKFGSDHRVACERLGCQVDWTFVFNKFPMMTEVFSENVKNGRDQCRRFADKYDGKSLVFRNNTLREPSYGWNCDRQLMDWFVAELNEGRKVSQSTAAIKMAEIVPDGKFKTKGWKSVYTRFKIRNKLENLTTAVVRTEYKSGSLEARLHSAKCYKVEKTTITKFKNSNNLVVVDDTIMIGCRVQRVRLRAQDIAAEKKLKLTASTQICRWWRTLNNVKIVPQQAPFSTSPTQQLVSATKSIPTMDEHAVQSGEGEHADDLMMIISEEVKRQIVSF
jgi:hypothetical protein